MAQDAPGFQTQAVIAGEVEKDGAGHGVHRQDLQDAVGMTAVEAANLDGVDLVEGDAGEGALVMLAVPRLALPDKAVGDEDEAALLGQICHLADWHERVLEDGGDDGEILRILRPELEAGV